MKHVFTFAGIAFFFALAALCSPQRAQAAASCSIDATTLNLGNVIANYSPFQSSTWTDNVPSGTLKFSCNGLGTSRNIVIYVSGAANYPSYTAPKVGPVSGFNLGFNLCVPGTAPPSCTIWNTTSGWSFTASSGSVMSQPIPQFTINVGRQDAVVGNAASGYTGTLYFTFTCGGNAC